MAPYKLRLLFEAVIRLGSQPPKGEGRGETTAYVMMIGYGRVRVREPIRTSVQFKHKPHTHTAQVSCSNGESGGKVGVFRVEVQTLS